MKFSYKNTLKFPIPSSNWMETHLTEYFIHRRTPSYCGRIFVIMFSLFVCHSSFIISWKNVVLVSFLTKNCSLVWTQKKGNDPIQNHQTTKPLSHKPYQKLISKSEFFVFSPTRMQKTPRLQFFVRASRISQLTNLVSNKT